MSASSPSSLRHGSRLRRLVKLCPQLVCEIVRDVLVVPVVLRKEMQNNVKTVVEAPRKSSKGAASHLPLLRVLWYCVLFLPLCRNENLSGLSTKGVAAAQADPHMSQTEESIRSGRTSITQNVAELCCFCTQHLLSQTPQIRRPPGGPLG